MKKGKIYFKSLSRIIKYNPIYALLLLAIIFFSTIFSAYVYRIGITFAYSNTSKEAPYKYEFIVKDTSTFDKGKISEAFDSYNFNDYDISPYVDFKDPRYGEDSYMNIYNINCVGKAEEFQNLKREYLGFIEEYSLEQYTNLSKYITKDDIISKKHYVVINKPHDENFATSKFCKLKINDELTINNVNYTVKAVDSFDIVSEKINENNASLPEVSIIDCDELDDTYKSILIKVSVNKKISNPELNNLAKQINAENGAQPVVGIILGFFVLAAVFCSIFVVNAAILFKFFIKSQDKLYGTYKMLGAKFSQILLTMLIQTLPICLLGTAIGIGADFLLAPVTQIFEDAVTYLDWVGVLLIGLLNIVGMAIGFAIACVKQAKALPIDSGKEKL